MVFGDFSEFSTINIMIRILVATILGGIIGLDRGLKHRGAGTKTNTIVCLGATLVMLIEQYIQIYYPGLANMNRMSAQVISGVGFLGVGTIITSGHRVKGLTTAATLWACACVGLAVGAGFVDGAIFVTIMMLVSLHVLPYVERFATRKSKYYTVLLEVDKAQHVHSVVETLKQNDLVVDSLEVMNGKSKGLPISVYLVLFSKSSSNEKISEILYGLEQVLSVEIL